MSSTNVSAAEPCRPLSQRAMTVFAATSLGAILAGSSAPTPLYRLYQESWALSPIMLTVIFSVYALSLLLSLLTVGSLSDYVGRRPVIFAALLLSALSMALFIEADGASWLIAARVVQGLATGALTSTLGAVILDTHRSKGALINSITPFFGMSVGALGASALAAYAPAPMQLVYIILLAAFLVLALLVWLMPETADPQPGALASLRPHVAVPPQARRALLLITPVNIAVWALGGFYLSLMPSLFRAATGLTSPFLGGIVVAALTLSGAVSVLSVRHWPAPSILVAGTVTLVAGVAVTLSGVHLQAASLLLLGTVIAGLGFGAGFFGGARTIMPLAGLHERAGLLAAFYVQSYLAFSLPVILVGLLAPRLGLPLSTYIYGAAIIVLAIISLAATLISLGKTKAAATPRG